MNRKGFTLVEILLTSTILVILGLAILTLINPLTQIFKGYDTVRKTDLAKLSAAFEAYYEDHGCYPPISILNNCGGSDLAPYLDKIPCDPNTKKPYLLYYYPQTTTCSQNFVIYANLANAFDPEGDKIPTCEDVYASYSPGSTEAIIITGCSGRRICSVVYGCVNGVCQVVAEDTFNVCDYGPGYCDVPNCRGYCGPQQYECFRH